MFDKELAKEILKQILSATDKILYRFKPVSSVSYFTDSPGGMEKLDSICMLLIAIGEALKNFDKITNNTVLPSYPDVNWKGAKAMRDIISHHYFNIDAEIIYNVCENNILALNKTIRQILLDIK